LRGPTFTKLRAGKGSVGRSLRREPLRKFCLERRHVTAATIANHIVPHHGDWTVFVTGKLQSLCEPCHKSTKQEIELHGYLNDIGLDAGQLILITQPIAHASHEARMS
jgi:hypothetical protein